ncbi:MAG: glycosyltransferase [Veillonellales bacterium]
MLEVAFYGAILLIVYTYIVFPILLYLLTKIKKDMRCEESNFDTTNSPSVAIICAMYNEEKVVYDKIQNFLELTYDNAILYIGSDGSSDRTNIILREYAYEKKIHIYEFSRRGKVYVINDLLNHVREDIIVFTDANSIFEKKAIINLVKYFNNPKVGAVCGRLNLLKNGQHSGEGFYWRYETFIKTMENRINCVMGANGAIYAIRRELAGPLPSNTINDDFTMSMRVIEKGYDIKYAKNAVANEEINHDDTVEFKRHIRDGAGHYRAVFYLIGLFNPFHPKAFFLYLSHRIIRWLVPFLLIALLILPWLMTMSVLSAIINVFQALFYIFASIGWITRTQNKFFYIPFYFLYINIALMLGFIRNLLGKQKVTWNSTQR